MSLRAYLVPIIYDMFHLKFCVVTNILLQVATKRNGATTVSATMFFAALVTTSFESLLSLSTHMNSAITFSLSIFLVMIFTPIRVYTNTLSTCRLVSLFLLLGELGECIDMASIVSCTSTSAIVLQLVRSRCCFRLCNQ